MLLPITLAAAPVCCLTACANGTDQDVPEGSVVLWTLSEPTLQIGVVEGDPNYELHQAIRPDRLGRCRHRPEASQDLRYGRRFGNASRMDRRDVGLRLIYWTPPLSFQHPD